MSFGGRAPSGPAGGAYSGPPDPLAALKLIAPSALDPRRLRRLASRLQRSETKRSGSSFFHSNTVISYSLCLKNAVCCWFGLCSLKVVDDKCKPLEGLGEITDLKSNALIDVIVAAPCSIGKLCSSEDSILIDYHC